MPVNATRSASASTRAFARSVRHCRASAAERLSLAEPYLHAGDRRRERRDDRFGLDPVSKGHGGKSGGNVAAAKEVGKLIAERAKEKGINKVVFDRGGYLYHGRIKALADAAREAGLEF